MALERSERLKSRAIFYGWVTVASMFAFGSTFIFGLSVGAGMIVQSYIFASYYGRAFLGAIRGIVMPITLVSAGIGGLLSGYLRDARGSYVSSWWLILGIYLRSTLIMVTIRPPSHRGRPVAQ